MCRRAELQLELLSEKHVKRRFVKVSAARLPRSQSPDPR